ncbi:riboflavin biosynthesis protein RibF [Myxococcota bacterium]|nr:riboflavin biosynthesis protein RibF [Myxococcota bacterium]MBU1412265.1 riboflavin biosynthesis protein RibF [Myxococcota bacterium]MBU1511051.1 riboflavin biosynthesis protein RibF [Myxococcota bacterium]
MRQLWSYVGLQLDRSLFPPVFSTLADAGRELAPDTAVIGNFDGVHIGHRKLFSFAKSIGRRVVAVTFTPHPAAFFHKFDYRPLAPEVWKLVRLFEAGADGVANLPFSAEFARMPAESFAAALVGSLRVSNVAVGEDFHFGTGREGDIALLEACLGRFGARLHVLPLESVDGRPVHSRTIREALSAGDLETANAMLGGPYTLHGEVEQGFGWGRKLGFPTANLRTEQWIPADGVYAAIARVGTCPVACAFSIGRRETLGDDLPLALEAHLLDFDGDVYGHPISVCLHRFLRPQNRFGSHEDLIRQVRTDVAQVATFFGGPHGHP